MQSHRSCRAWILGLACCVALGAGAAPASAAHVFGGSISQTSDDNLEWEGCGTPAGCAYFQVLLDDVNAAQAAQNGVITSWRAKGDDFGATGTGTGAVFTADLELQPVPDPAEITRRRTSPFAPVTLAAPVHQVRIPVAKDQIVGFIASEDTALAASEIILSEGHEAFIIDPAPVPDIVNANGVGRNEILGFEITVEPDTDNDGYGDESQDGCPTQATPATPGGPCPPVVKPPVVVIPPAFTAEPSVKTTTQGKASRVVFNLSKAGLVEGKIEKATVGRKAGKKCVKRTRKNTKKRRCTRYVKSGRTKSLSGAAGSNARSLGKLKAGSYRLTLTPTLSGTRGREFKVFFKVKPKPKNRKR